MKNKSLAGAAILFTIAGALWLLNQYSPGTITPQIVQVIRWAGIGALFLYGIAKRSGTTWIFIAMLIGASIGHDWPKVGVNMRVITLIFLRLVKMLIAPLMFAILVQGLARQDDLKKTGRMGVKAIIYFEIVTTIAILIGVAAGNISKAGLGIHMPGTGEPVKLVQLTASDAILNIFPENIAKSIAEGYTLQIVVFCILFGIGLAMVSPERRQPLLAFCDSLAAAMFKVTNVVMLFAPFGVGAAIANSVGHTGLGVLVSLAKLVVTMYLALIVLVVCVILPIALAFRVPVRRFVKAVAEPWTISFATTDCLPAMPRAIEELEALGVSRHAIGVVLPTGYSLNMDGSSVYLSLATIFVAQVAGIHLTLGRELGIILMLMLASKGVANAPRASLVVLFATLTSLGLPIEPLFILMGVDEVMDMARSSINIVGNMLATIVVAKMEGEYQLKPEAPPAALAAEAS